ncbi:hypothetical protein [Streptomyces sp. NPDC001292]
MSPITYRAMGWCCIHVPVVRPDADQLVHGVLRGPQDHVSPRHIQAVSSS